jgi:hypothetical protein
MRGVTMSTEEPVQPKTTEADVNKTAAEEAAKVSAKPKLSETEQRGFQHRLGKENADLLNDEGGIELGRKLLKGTNKEYADTGRYLGIKGSGKMGEITPDDLSRSGMGKGMNPLKAQIIKGIRESADPHSLVEHWGGR